MKRFLVNIFIPHRLLEKWSTRKNTKKIFPLITIMFVISAISNEIWNFPYFYLFFISFTIILTIVVLSEIRYTKDINSIRSLTTINGDGFKKANLSYLRFEETKWMGIFPLLIVAIFGIGGLSIFGALAISPTLVLCLSYFGITVYFSIVGYVQYILLLIYIIQISTDKMNYKNVSELISDRLPAEVNWLQMLTKLTHFYRTIFFTVGAFYIIAFGFYCSAPRFHAMTNHSAYFILWGIIVVAIVIAFPIISVIEYYQIKNIVKKVKSAYLQETKDNMYKESEKISIERTILNQLFSASILASADYPVKNTPGIIYACIIALINIAGSVDTLIQLGERFLG
jgi:hypothetical protein